MRRVVHFGPADSPGGMSTVINTLDRNPPKGWVSGIIATHGQSPIGTIRSWIRAMKKLREGFDNGEITIQMAHVQGQKPVYTKFKKSISNFKTRKGANAGVKVTLRSSKMYEFIDRLVNIALPRVKDFRGLSSKNIDNSNNFSFGIKEHIIFPEVNFDKVDKIRGLDVTIVTSSNNKNATIELLKEFNFPINDKKN